MNSDKILKEMLEPGFIERNPWVSEVCKLLEKSVAKAEFVLKTPSLETSEREAA